MRRQLLSPLYLRVSIEADNPRERLLEVDRRENMGGSVRNFQDYTLYVVCMRFFCSTCIHVSILFDFDCTIHSIDQNS